MTTKPLDGPELRATARQLVDDLAELRRQRGYTQHQLASRIGIGQPGISLFENHRRVPNLETLLRYADAVGAEITFVMRRSGQ